MNTIKKNAKKKHNGKTKKKDNDKVLKTIFLIYCIMSWGYMVMLLIWGLINIKKYLCIFITGLVGCIITTGYIVKAYDLLKNKYLPQLNISIGNNEFKYYEEFKKYWKIEKIRTKQVTDGTIDKDVPCNYTEWKNYIEKKSYIADYEFDMVLLNRYRTIDTYIDTIKTLMFPVVLSFVSIDFIIRDEDINIKVAIIIAKPIIMAIILFSSLWDIINYEKEKRFILDLRDIIARNKETSVKK